MTVMVGQVDRAQLAWRLWSRIGALGKHGFVHENRQQMSPLREAPLSRAVSIAEQVGDWLPASLVSPLEEAGTHALREVLGDLAQPRMRAAGSRTRVC